jgi:hypothetical protein
MKRYRKVERKFKLTCDICKGAGVYILESGIVLCERHRSYPKSIFETRDEYIERVRKSEGLK